LNDYRELLLAVGVEEQAPLARWLTVIGVELNVWFLCTLIGHGITLEEALKVESSPESISNEIVGLLPPPSIINIRAYLSGPQKWSGFDSGLRNGFEADCYGHGLKSIDAYELAQLYCDHPGWLPASVRVVDPRRTGNNSGIDPIRYSAFEDFETALRRGIPLNLAIGLLRDATEYQYIRMVGEQLGPHKMDWRQMAGGFATCDVPPWTDFVNNRVAFAMLRGLMGLWREYIASTCAQACIVDIAVCYAVPSFRVAIAWAYGYAASLGTGLDQVDTWRQTLRRINPSWDWAKHPELPFETIWHAWPLIHQGNWPELTPYEGSAGPTPGSVACLAHRNVVIITDSGPTSETPRMHCGCVVGVGDHRISRQVAVLKRGPRWSSH
jgi:hypothetical protein